MVRELTKEATEGFMALLEKWSKQELQGRYLKLVNVLDVYFDFLYDKYNLSSRDELICEHHRNLSAEIEYDERKGLVNDG